VIEFVLFVYLNGSLIDKTQKFKDMDRCLYFSSKLSAQPPVPTGEGKRLKMHAICKPVPKR